MKSFPSEVRFEGQWRDYQLKCLQNLDFYLKDKHFHLIAPPGSGKTLLGLEIILRINTPTLVFVPTLALRDQWIQRFKEYYCKTSLADKIISKDLLQPGLITISTYQGIYSLLENKKISFNKFIISLKSYGVSTLLFDEAHHLKKSWWESLIKLKTGLDSHIIALTATPPYNSSDLEWNRYILLNGPIDFEISIPELVKSGSLCPHQDFIYINTIPTNELSELNALINNKQENANKWINNSDLIFLIEQSLKDELNLYFKFPELLILCLSYLKEKNKVLTQIIATELDIDFESLPKIENDQIEILLHYVVQNSNNIYSKYNEKIKAIKSLLIKQGFWIKGKPNFKNINNIEKIISNSKTKFQSIKEIIHFELSQLKSNLRLCIICDYIYKDDLNIKSASIFSSRFGVIPLFNDLIKDGHLRESIGVLTGNILILNRKCFDEYFYAKINDYDFYENDFILIRNYSKNNDIPKITTRLFNQGLIKILIGTKSFLGEGWDAPSINTLIIASNTKAFVSSNQIRGRALRVDPSNNYKTANIWHLTNYTPKFNLSEWTLIKKRFQHFITPSRIHDFQLRSETELFDFDETKLEDWNSDMFSLAAKRDTYFKSWNIGISVGKSLVKGIRLKKSREIKKNSFLIFDYFINTLYKSKKPIRYFLHYNLGFKSKNQYQIEFNTFLETISIVIIKSLYKTKIFSRNFSITQVYIKSFNNGSFEVILDDSNLKESTIFNTCIKEFISMKLDTRYLIKQSFTFQKKTEDIYFPIPTILSKKKDFAEVFLFHWSRYFIYPELIPNYSNNNSIKELAPYIQNLKNTDFIFENLEIWK